MSTQRIYPGRDFIFCVFWLLRLPQLFCTCVAFSLVADMGIWRGVVGNWSMSFWCICFAMTLIISIVELYRRWSFFPFFWCSFSVTYTCCTTLLCLSAPITYSVAFVPVLPDGPYRDRAVTASRFSSVTSVLCAM